MKKLFGALLIIFFAVVSITSCKKSNDLKSAQTTQSKTAVKPDVLQCETGYQWDYYLKKCVPICPSGYHNDSITGACVVDGGGGTSSSLTVVKNSNNPLDYFGSDHNSGMTNIIPQYDYGQLQASEENVEASAKNWQYAIGVDTTNFTANINWMEEHFGEQMVSAHNFDNGIDTAYSQGYISWDAKNYLINLSNETKSFYC
jgi:hypothetical protein